MEGEDPLHEFTAQPGFQFTLVTEWGMDGECGAGRAEWTRGDKVGSIAGPRESRWPGRGQ